MLCHAHMRQPLVERMYVSNLVPYAARREANNTDPTIRGAADWHAFTPAPLARESPYVRDVILLLV